MADGVLEVHNRLLQSLSHCGLILWSNETPTKEAGSLPVMSEEVEEAVRSLKAGKSEGVDNIPCELLKKGGEATTTVLTTICQKILETKQWSKAWTQSHSD